MHIVLCYCAIKAEYPTFYKKNIQVKYILCIILAPYVVARLLVCAIVSRVVAFDFLQNGLS